MAAPNGGYSFALSRARLALAGSAAPLELAAPWPAALALGSCAAYALFVIAAASSTWWRAGVRRLAQAHHGLLFAYSAAAFSAALAHLVSSGEAAEYLAWLVAPGSGSPPAAPRLYCAPVPPWLRLVSLSFTLSKIWEWGDTLVLIAQGKSVADIGALHLYHHCTTFALFLVVANVPVTEKAGLLLNGGVHTLMYYHFAFRLPRAMRPLVTALQIVQLAVVTWWWIDATRFCADAAAYRRENALEYSFPFATVPVYLLLFVKFFVESYMLGPKVKQKEV